MTRHFHQRRRSREAGAPSSRRRCQSLLGRRRGGTTPRAETGAYRVARPRSCGGGHAKRGAPSSKRRCQSLLGRRRGRHYPSSGGCHAKRGLRPQGAQRRRGGTPPRSVTAKLPKRPCPYIPCSTCKNPASSPHTGKRTRGHKLKSISEWA